MLLTADLFFNLFSFLEPKQYLDFPDSHLPLKLRKLTNKSEYVFRESLTLDSLGFFPITYNCWTALVNATYNKLMLSNSSLD